MFLFYYVCPIFNSKYISDNYITNSSTNNILDVVTLIEIFNTNVNSINIILRQKLKYIVRTLVK